MYIHYTSFFFLSICDSQLMFMRRALSVYTLSEIITQQANHIWIVQLHGLLGPGSEEDISHGNTEPTCCPYGKCIINLQTKTHIKPPQGRAVL